MDKRGQHGASLFEKTTREKARGQANWTLLRLLVKSHLPSPAVDGRFDNTPLGVLFTPEVADGRGSALAAVLAASELQMLAFAGV